MGLLKMLMGSSQAQEGFKDFLNRFEQGNPWEGYDDQEVLDRYGEVSHKVSSSDYEQAARDAFGHLSQTDREEFGRMLAGQAQSRAFTPSRVHTQSGTELWRLGLACSDHQSGSSATGTTSRHSQRTCWREKHRQQRRQQRRRQCREHIKQPSCQGCPGRDRRHAGETSTR